MLKTDLEKMKIGEYKDWKFGFITREIYKIDHDKFELNDTSDGWVSAIVDFQTMSDLIEGKLSLLEINFK